MKITCPKCKARLTLPDEKLKPEGTRFRCSKCQASLFYKRKGPQAPQSETSEQMSTFPLPTIREPQPISPPAVPNSERQIPVESEASVADSGDIRPDDAFAESGQVVEKQEKPKKEETVRESFRRHPATVMHKERRFNTRKKVLAGAAAGVTVLFLIAIFVFSLRDNKIQDNIHTLGANKGTVTSAAPTPADRPVSQVGSAGDVPAGQIQGRNAAEQPSAPIDEEKAIEIVKRSEALLRRTSVESIVKKWTEDNAAKLKVVGWSAKKVDEQKYLVSFTALEGNMQKGFYFELDAQSGVVQSILQNPELQKKYNIQ